MAAPAAIARIPVPVTVTERRPATVRRRPTAALPPRPRDPRPSAPSSRATRGGRLDPAAAAGSFDEAAPVDPRPLGDSASVLAPIVAGHNIKLVPLSLEASESRLGRDHGAR